MKHDKKERVLSRSEESHEPSQSDRRVRLFPAWCKRCGNCAAFCPTGALEMDEWGYPRVAHPELCTACHLCEKLCPDFAITVTTADHIDDEEHGKPSQIAPGFPEDRSHSAERLAPDPDEEEAPLDEE